MKAHYKAFGGRLLVEVEGTTIKDLIKEIGPIAEILDADHACGKCLSTNIYPRCRTAQDKYDYYELVCSDCNARLSFGQHMDGGTLWAKRADKNGALLDYRGWTIYQALPPGSGKPPEPPPGTGRPRPTPPAQPTAAPASRTVKEQNEHRARLADILKRTGDEGSNAQTLGEICEAIAGLSSDQNADRAWTQITDEHGDPTQKPAALGAVMGALLWVVMDLEAQKGRKTA
jgi:hypothetical protein